MSEEESGLAHHEGCRSINIIHYREVFVSSEADRSTPIAQISQRSDPYPSRSTPFAQTDSNAWYPTGSHHAYESPTSVYHPLQYAPLNVALPSENAMYQRPRDILGQIIAFAPTSYYSGSRFSLTIMLDYDLQLWAYTVWLWYDDIPMQAELVSRSGMGYPSYHMFVGLVPSIGPSNHYGVYTKYSVHDHLGNMLASRTIAQIDFRRHCGASGPSFASTTWMPSLPSQAYSSNYQSQHIALPHQPGSLPQYYTPPSMPCPASDHHIYHEQPLGYPADQAHGPPLRSRPNIIRSNTAQPRGASTGLLKRRFDGARITKRYAKTPEPASSFRRKMAVTSGPGNPPLVRTSTIRFRPGANSHLPQYSLYSPKASELHLDGDLKNMAKDWTDDEKLEKRRLIEFSRSQQHNVVSVTFKAITKEERVRDGICVSCIWWEEEDETYITSVNMIELLERLVAARFTVEEKNRIRRNLEGFKPLTVSKEKAADKLDTSSLFQVIMGFPDPKPRNIEKDVKVFPWKILSKALEKIISKYVRSPTTCV